MNAFPPWLKAHQHGSIGEARTRAFLLDRFWILERSVDIHGVDFIIQRRLYGRDILDPAPPRFGVVQAKFVQDEKTTQKVSKDLVLDEEGQPRFEAFVLVHTGDEETQEMFLLSASDIQRDFECQEERFLLPAKVLLSSGKYVVQSKKLALDRIEDAVRCADFYKNRMFIFRELPSEVPDFDAIVPEYKEEMEYWFGSIPEVFWAAEEAGLRDHGANTETSCPPSEVLRLGRPHRSCGDRRGITR